MILKSFISFLSEAAETHGVLAFGRMNPITSGHEKVVNKIHDVAKAHNAKHHALVVSHTQDPKKNPLSAEQKVKHAKRAFPGTNVTAASKESPTIMHHAAQMHDKGVEHLHVIAGSDRVGEFQKTLERYNGKKGGYGHYNFKSITVHSAGERDPDAEGTTGISASKMREHVKNNDYESFKKGAPTKMKEKHVKELFNDVKSGMNPKK